MIFNYFVSFYKSNKLRIAILISSIAIYFALTIVILSLNQSLPQIAALPFKSIGVSTVVQKTGQLPESMQGAIFPHSNGPIYQEELLKLKNLAFAQSSDAGLYFWYFDDQFFKTVLGISNQGSILSKLLKDNIEEGEYSLQKNEILVTADFAKKNELTIGSKVTFENEQFTVAAILQANITGNIIPADIYMNLNKAQAISNSSKEMRRVYKFKNSDFINILVIKTNPKWIGDKEALIQKIDKDYLIFSEKTFNKEIVGQIALISTISQTMFGVLGVILLIVFSLLILYNFKTREKEIAILRMIGWSFSDLRKQFVAESALLVGISLIVGNVLALLSLLLLKQQTITMELPWELSAKPHFLPQENNINRIISTNLPIDFQPWLFIGLSIVFFVFFGCISYLVFNRIKKLKPAEYLK